MPRDDDEAMLGAATTWSSRRGQARAAVPRDEATDSTLGAEPVRVTAPRIGPGSRIGRYTLGAQLGAGGMGVVFAARDPDLDRTIALKILRADRRGDAAVRARLLREARAMAKLSHPHVIAVHEVGTDGGVDFIAMERIDGQNGAQWLLERRPAHEVLRVFGAAGRGLAAAHAAGLIHRDFKPHNVLIGRDGRVVVTDFGLARALAEPTETENENETALDAATLSSSLTAAGEMLGTPAYMAPEQLATAATGPATDQFALAVSLWEGLAGTRPFPRASLGDLLRAIEDGVPEGGESIPGALRRVLLRALARAPSARWPTVDAMLDALERAARRPRAIAIGGAVAAVAIAAVAAYLTTRPGARPALAACPAPEVTLLRALPVDLRVAVDRHFGAQPDWQKLRPALDRFALDWRDVERDACRAPDSPARTDQLACLSFRLDNVRALFDVLRDAPPELPRVVLSAMTSPTACDGTERYPQPPDAADAAQVTQLRSELVRVLALVTAGHADQARDQIASVVMRARSQPYRPVLADALIFEGRVLWSDHDAAGARAAFQEAANQAEAADDARDRAEALVQGTTLLFMQSADPVAIRAAADAAQAAIDGAGVDDGDRAKLLQLQAVLDARDGRFDDALAEIGRARDLDVRAHDRSAELSSYQIEADLRVEHGTRDDQIVAEILFRSILAQTAVAEGPDSDGVRSAERSLAALLIARGAYPEAHRLLAHGAVSGPGPSRLVHHTGRVIDVNGRAVAGAIIGAAGADLQGDALVASLSLGDEDSPTFTATSDGDGRFAIDAPADAIAVAEASDRRSRPTTLTAGETTLLLGRTGGVAGSVEVSAGAPSSDPTVALARAIGAPQVSVSLAGKDHDYEVLAPVDEHGRYATAGVPTAAAVVQATVRSALLDRRRVVRPVAVRAGDTAVADLPISLDGAVLDVVVRADRQATIPNGMVYAFAGAWTIERQDQIAEVLRRASSSAAIAFPIDPQTATAAGQPLYQAGDLHARLGLFSPGPATICVIPFGGSMLDPDYGQQLDAHFKGLEPHCVTVQVAASPPVQAFVVETSAAKRFDTAR